MRANDDYGVGDIRLVYSVNGGPEDTLSVFRTGGSPLSEVSTGHTLFLEEWELEPGDNEPFGLTRDEIRGALGAAGLVSVSVVTGFEVVVHDETMSPLMGSGRRSTETSN